MKSDSDQHKTTLSSAAVEQIERALSDHFSGAAVMLYGPISVRGNSEIFRAHIDAHFPIEVAVKHCLVAETKLPDESAAKEQFLALERVNNAFVDKTSRYRVPTPIHIATTLATFSMSWVDGESLTKKMRQPSIFVDGTAWFEDIGAWLGHFHKSGPIRHQRIDLDERLKAVEECRASAISDKSYAYAIQLLEKKAASLKNIEVAVTWLHGDCKTDNFILNRESVFGIDISLRCENPAEYDLAQFLNNLDLLLSRPSYLHLLGMKKTFEKAFWRGYISTGPAVSNSYLNWLRLTFIVSFWEDMLKARKHNIRTWILNRMFSKLAKRLSHEIYLLN